MKNITNTINLKMIIIITIKDDNSNNKLAVLQSRQPHCTKKLQKKCNFMAIGANELLSNYLNVIHNAYFFKITFQM